MAKQIDWNNTHNPFEQWARIFKNAANNTLTKLPQNQKQPYITAETWDYICQKAEALEQNDFDKAKQIEKQIRTHVKKTTKENTS